MTIAFVASGALASGSTSLSVAYPAGLSSGDLLLLCVVNKYPVNGPSTPSGWTLVAQKSGGVGASGADSGSVYSTVFSKVADGTESGSLSVTITSGNSSLGRMLCYSNATGGWDIANTTDDDTVASTSLSFTFPANPGVTAGDFVVAACGANGTSATYSSPSFTQTGITFGTPTQRNGSGTTTGDNCDCIIYDVSVNSGTASAAPVFVATANTTFGNYPAGASVFVRLREASAGPTTYTLNADSVAIAVTLSNADLLRTRALDADPVSVAVTLANADLLRTYVTDADPLSIIVTLADADLVVVPAGTYALDADPLSVAVTLADAQLLVISNTPAAGGGTSGSGGGWKKDEWKKKRKLFDDINETIDAASKPPTILQTAAEPARFISPADIATLTAAILPPPAAMPKIFNLKRVKKAKPIPATVIEDDDYDEEELGIIALLAG